MKHFILSFAILAMGFCFTACSGGGKDGETEENKEEQASTDVVADKEAKKLEAGDAQGEDEEVSNVIAAKQDDSFVRFKANGIDMECKYQAKESTTATSFQRKKDDSYSLITFQRGTTEQMREAIMINFINYNPRKLDFPYELKSEPGKQVQVDYKVKKSGVYITYFANSQNSDYKFKVTLTGYDSGVLKGTFEGEVKNEAQKVVKIEKGEFEVKLEEVVIDANNPA